MDILYTLFYRVLLSQYKFNCKHPLLLNTTTVEYMAARTLLLATALGALAAPGHGQVGMCYVPGAENRTLYDFHLRNVHLNETLDFSQYRGKVVLVVNVATYWGHTYQYHGLNALQNEYSGDLQVVGVPCNQFHYVSILHIIYSCRLQCYVMNIQLSN